MNINVIISLLMFKILHSFEGIQIDCNWKFRDLNWDVLKFEGAISNHIVIQEFKVKLSLK